MVNKVSEDVKAFYESHNVVLEKVKALVESNMAMEGRTFESARGSYEHVQRRDTIS